MHNRHVLQYLKNYAEPETEILSTILAAQWQACVVIPAFNETPVFLERFYKTFCSHTKHYLLILVVNRPDNVPHHTCNKTLISYVNEIMGSPIWQNRNLSLQRRNNITVLLADRSSASPVPLKQGVGLARKIGCDLACALFKQGFLERPWIYSSDADTLLPHNYFEPRELPPDTAASVFEFSHESWNGDTDNPPNPQTLYATQQYETHLRFYKNGLTYAGSPYAFYTLGSTLAISIPHYCAARGFPKRAAGEDFYLLNKLAKLGQVASRPEIHIKIQPRLSQRVPFGTGPAVQRICEQVKTDTPYLTYNPKIFTFLRDWLRSVDRLWLASQSNCESELPLDNELKTLADAIELNRFMVHAKHQARSQEQFHKQFHQWFDAFMTLKFIHYFQKNGWPPVPLNTALEILNDLNHD